MQILNSFNKIIDNDLRQEAIDTLIDVISEEELTNSTEIELLKNDVIEFYLVAEKHRLTKAEYPFDINKGQLK